MTIMHEPHEVKASIVPQTLAAISATALGLRGQVLANLDVSRYILTREDSRI